MIKVVSFDIFQTLVDVNERIPQIWQRILQDKYSKELGERGAKVVLSSYPDVIKVALNSSDYFYTMDEVYMMCARKALQALQYPVTARTVVDNLINTIPPEIAFISDDLHSYKGSIDKQFFAQVLKVMDVSPKEIVHIGDSSHDIIGAKRAGIPCVWLNRENRIWSNEYLPDVTIHSLSELEDVIAMMECSYIHIGKRFILC